MDTISNKENYNILIITCAIFVVVILIWYFFRKAKPIEHTDASYPDWLEYRNYANSVVEINLTADIQNIKVLNGKETTFYTFGSYPGPLIKARTSSTLIVNFQNLLEEPVGIEWVGIQSDDQIKVPPGGYKRYTLRLDRPGLFGYQSNTERHVYMGLIGAIWVQDRMDEPNIMMITSLDLDEDNQIIVYPSDRLDRLEKEINSQSADQLYLVNGIQDGLIQIEKSILQVYNASSTIVSLYLQDHDMSIRDRMETCLEISPGEREEIVFDARQDYIKVMRGLINKGLHNVSLDDSEKIVMEYAEENIDDPYLVTLYFPTYEFQEIPLQKCDYVLDDIFDAPDIPITYGMLPSYGNINYFTQVIDGQAIPGNMLTLDQIPTVFQNKVYILEIVNTTPFLLNFHLEASFQLIETIKVIKNKYQLIPNKDYIARDTVIIPRPTKTYRIITRLAVKFQQKGIFQYKCTMFSKAKNGMYGYIRVV